MTTFANPKRLRFGTWNVKTLYQAGKLAQASRILESYGLSFLGLSEMRWNQNGQMVTTKGHLVLWSGMPNANDIHQRGVGMLVHRSIRNTIMDYEFVNERIMRVRFRCKAKNLTVFQCYAPTEDAEEDVKQQFYDKLNKLLSEAPKHDLKLLMGDINAKVGNDNDGIEHVMGKHGIGEMNKNGELLVELCGLNDLRIGGTLFPHKDCHKVTWVSPDSRTQNQIDHICISSKWSSTLCDVRSKRGADIGSDHHLLMGQLRLKLSYVPRRTQRPRIKYNIAKLKTPEQRTAFTDNLRGKFAETSANYDDIQQSYNRFRNAVNNTCAETLGTNIKKKDDSISPDTWKLIDERSMFKNKINSLKTVNERKAAQNEYIKLDRRVKRSIQNDYREQINSLTKKAEEAAGKNNLKDLYDITKKIAGNAFSRSVPVKDRHGRLLTNVDEQLSRWREYFEEVFNLNRTGITVIHKENITPLPIRTVPPSMAEVTSAIKAMKNGKAAGVDNITAEVLKVDVRLIANELHPLLIKIWERESYPDDLVQGIIVKLGKKGDLTDCNNWRGINIMCVVMKILMWIILNRMVKTVDSKLRPEQAGFREGRSCIDQINTLRIIIEQSVELRSPLYLLFVDYEKAFDSVNRECIWAELRNIGVPDKIISLIRKSYEAFECKVLHEGKLSEPFKTQSGVRQGCLLSPLIFLVVMDAVYKRASENKPRGIMWDPLNVNKRLECLDYADDKCELSHRQQDMQLKLDDLSNESAKVGLLIHPGKTKEMRINHSSDQSLTLNGQPIERVQEFQYLGSMMTEDGGARRDVESRVKKARGAFIQLNKVWRSNTYSVKTKIRIFNSCVISVLLYGSETWLVSVEITNRLQVFVNRCLRRILKIFWPNTISNQELYARTEHQNINLQIRKRKYGWIGHTLRKHVDEVVKRALVFNPQGSRRRGRPKNTWRRSTISEVNTLPDTNIKSLWDLQEKASRRSRWKQFVDCLCTL